MALHDRLERMTRRGWFYLVILLMQFLPPYVQRGTLDVRATGSLVTEIISNSLALSVNNFYIFLFFKLAPLVLLLLAILSPKMGILFHLFAVFHYFVMAFLQNVAFLETYGWTVLTVNVVLFSLVALSFLEEVFARKHHFVFGPINWEKVFLVGLAVFAFWYPLHPYSFSPDFQIKYFFTNYAGLTFCMMTPFYLVVLLLSYPRVNLVNLRVAGLVGTIIGIYNVNVNFIFNFSLLWWNGILHIPLLLISLRAFILSFKQN